MRLAPVLLLVLLGGCALTPELAGTALGFGASALKLDDDLFNFWAAQRAVKVCPVPPELPGGPAINATP